MSLTQLKRRTTRARNAAFVTCPASRHLQLMALALADGRPYPMLTEEPQHCAESMLAVCAALWEARRAAQQKPISNLHEPPK